MKKMVNDPTTQTVVVRVDATCAMTPLTGQLSTIANFLRFGVWPFDFIADYSVGFTSLIFLS